MHESGIVEELIHEVEKVSRANGGGRVVRISVGIGELAGFSREHFEEHFRAASTGTIADGAALDVRMGDGDSLTLEAVELEET